MTDSLCWSCGNSFKDCSWFNDFVPVEGWDAKRYRIENNDYSYVIKSCPKFTYDGICARCIHYKKGKFLAECPYKKLHYSECDHSHNKFITHLMEE